MTYAGVAEQKQKGQVSARYLDPNETGANLDFHPAASKKSYKGLTLICSFGFDKRSETDKTYGKSQDHQLGKKLVSGPFIPKYGNLTPEEWREFAKHGTSQRPGYWAEKAYHRGVELHRLKKQGKNIATVVSDSQK